MGFIDRLLVWDGRKTGTNNESKILRKWRNGRKVLHFQCTG